MSVTVACVERQKMLGKTIITLIIIEEIIFFFAKTVNFINDMRLFYNSTIYSSKLLQELPWQKKKKVKKEANNQQKHNFIPRTNSRKN